MLIFFPVQRLKLPAQETFISIEMVKTSLPCRMSCHFCAASSVGPLLNPSCGEIISDCPLGRANISLGIRLCSSFYRLSLMAGKRGICSKAFLLEGFWNAMTDSGWDFPNGFYCSERKTKQLQCILHIDRFRAKDKLSTIWDNRLFLRILTFVVFLLNYTCHQNKLEKLV